MSKKHGAVNVDGVIGITDTPHFFCRIFQRDKSTDEIIFFKLRQRHFRQDPDEKDLHAVDLDHVARPEKTLVIHFQIEIGVDDRKVRTFFQKQKMGYAVVDLVISDGDHIRRQHIHQLDRRHAFIFRIDHGSAEHISGDGINDIFFFLPHLIKIAGKQGHTAHKAFVLFFRHKVAVHVVGM